MKGMLFASVNNIFKIKDFIIFEYHPTMKEMKFYIITSIFILFSVFTIGQNPILTLDPLFSEIKFDVGQTFFSTVKGEFEEFDGEFRINPERLEEGKVTLSVKSPSVFTDNEDRDNHLRTDDFLNVIEFPEITFESHKIELISEHTYKLYGTLTILGVSNPIELDLIHVDSKKDSRLRMSHNYEIRGLVKRSDYNMPGSIMIGNRVKINSKIRLLEE